MGGHACCVGCAVDRTLGRGVPEGLFGCQEEGVRALCGKGWAVVGGHACCVGCADRTLDRGVTEGFSVVGKREFLALCGKGFGWARRECRT